MWSCSRFLSDGLCYVLLHIVVVAGCGDVCVRIALDNYLDVVLSGEEAKDGGEVQFEAPGFILGRAKCNEAKPLHDPFAPGLDRGSQWCGCARRRWWWARVLAHGNVQEDRVVDQLPLRVALVWIDELNQLVRSLSNFHNRLISAAGDTKPLNLDRE